MRSLLFVAILFLSACAPVPRLNDEVKTAIYVGNARGPGVTLFSIDPGNGELKAVRDLERRNAVETPTRVQDLALRSRWLYGSTLQKPVLYRIELERKSGFLAQATEIPVQAEVSALAFQPGGEFLYGIARDWRGLLAYEVDDASGDLREIGGSPFAVRGEDGERALAESVGFSSDGKWLVAGTGREVVSFQASASGALVEASRASAQGKVSFVSFDPRGEYVAAAGGSERATIALFRFDSTSGALALAQEFELEGKRFPTGASFDPEGRFVHVTGNDRLGFGGWLRTFALDRAGEMLEPQASELEHRIAGVLLFDPSVGFALAFSRAGLHSLAYDADQGTLRQRSAVGLVTLPLLLGDTRVRRPLVVSKFR